MSLLVALVLDCKPVELVPFSARGFTKRNVTVVVTKTSVTVVEAGKPLFLTDGPAFAVMIAEDDGWVALKGPYPTGSIRIAPVAKGAAFTVVDPLEHLTPEERKRVPETSCGTSWFDGWRNTPQALELSIAQTEGRPFKLRVKPDGAVSR